MRRSHVLVVLTTVIALGFALPAAGASNPFKAVKQALGLAKKANASASAAKKSAAAAKKSAAAAGTKAQAALDALKLPVASAVNATNATNATNAVNAVNATNAVTAQSAVKAGSADNVIVLPTVKAPVSGAGATPAAARTAATEVPLFTRGPLTVYGKCFRDTAAARVYGEAYVKSSVDGSTLASDRANLRGGAAAEFLSVATPEASAIIVTNNVANDLADTGYSDDGQFQVLVPSGSFIDGYIAIGVKQGTLAGGNGPYPTGDGCLFNGVLNVG